MFSREIGDTFEYKKGKKKYILKCQASRHGICDNCFFKERMTNYNGYQYWGCSLDDDIREDLVGDCDGYCVVLDREIDPSKEITKDDITELTKAIKSIGEAMKIVEMFKQLNENNKNV